MTRIKAILEGTLELLIEAVGHIVFTFGLIVIVCFVKIAVGYARLPQRPPSMSDGITITGISNANGHWEFCTVRWREVRTFTTDDSGHIIPLEY